MEGVGKMVVTAVGVNSAKGVIFTLLGLTYNSVRIKRVFILTVRELGQQHSALNGLSVHMLAGWRQLWPAAEWMQSKTHCQPCLVPMLPVPYTSCHSTPVRC